MNTESLALRLYTACVDHEQTAYRVDPRDDLPAVRSCVRRLARENGVGIRTAMLHDVLVVVLLDAAVWHESAAQMRAKFTPDS